MFALSYKKAIFLISLVIFFILTVLFWTYSIDDAFITYRYAENLADGRGLVFNPDDGYPVEGYSNFLWVLFLALAFKAGLPTYLTAKVVGLGLFLLSGILVYRRFMNQPGYAWLGGPLLLICPFTVLWGVSGLELGAHAFLILIALFYLADKSRKLFLVLPLLVLSRPEGAVIALVMIFTLLISRRNELSTIKNYAITGLAVTLATLAALTVFRLWYFDALLPNTIYAKTQHLWWLGIRASYIMLMTVLPLVLMAMLGIYFMLKDGFRNVYSSLISTTFLAQIGISSLADPVMNFHWRYLIPVLPLALLLALSGLEKLRYPSLRFALAVVMAIAVVFPFRRVTDTVKLEQEITKSQEAFLTWAEKAEPDATFTMTDMGRIPYYSGMRFNDLWGLVNRDIAREGYDLRRELERLPDYFVLVGYLQGGTASFRFGREAVLAGSMAFYHTYDFVDICYPAGNDPRLPGYYYLVFQRRPYAAEILKQSYSGDYTPPIR